MGKNPDKGGLHLRSHNIPLIQHRAYLYTVLKQKSPQKSRSVTEINKYRIVNILTQH